VRVLGLGALAGVALLLLPLAACGSGAGGDHSSGGSSRVSLRERSQESAAEKSAAEREEERESGPGLAADRGTCRADATAIEQPYGEGFPEDWTFPPRTTAFSYEDAGEAGVVVTAVSSAPFERVLAYLNEDAVDAGFEITDGETEEHDAEASWTAGRYDGRWTIRESGTCPGETVIQVLAHPAG
jgi:hypothetical protein